MGAALTDVVQPPALAGWAAHIRTDRVSVCKRGLVLTPILIHGYGRGGIGTTVTVTVGGGC